MALAKEKKTEVISNHRRAENDTGSPEVQIALITQRVEMLTAHLQGHAKDHASRRGLLTLVAQRRRLLTYLRKHHEDRYKAIVERLNLRK